MIQSQVTDLDFRFRHRKLGLVTWYQGPDMKQTISHECNSSKLSNWLALGNQTWPAMTFLRYGGVNGKIVYKFK